MGLFSSAQGYLGVDIGSSGIKIVELNKAGNDIKLLTYAFASDLKIELNTPDDIKQVSDLLLKLIEEAGVTTKIAVAALPTFSVFSSVLNLSNVNKKDISSAVHWEAKKVIPLPLDEMMLDWKVIAESNKGNNLKVMLTGAPKNLVKKYIEIFKNIQINLLSLETETFSLVRSLIGNDKSSVMLIDVGDTTTDISIILNSVPMHNRSIDVGGKNLSDKMSEIMGIDDMRARQFKSDLGLGYLNDQVEIPVEITNTFTPIVNEIKHVLSLYESKDNMKVEKIILSGGSAFIPGFSEHLAKIFNLNVVVGSPWSRIKLPEDLKPMLDELGPRLSVAAGLALRGLV